jgi:hypothetical protein
MLHLHDVDDDAVYVVAVRDGRSSTAATHHRG